MTATQVQRLAFGHEDLVAADAASGLTMSLTKYLDKHSKHKAAWERGRFLRNLKATAGVVETVSEAARKLGLVSGEILRKVLDTDAEAADLWHQTRLETRIAARRAVLDLVAKGSGSDRALRIVEQYLRDDDRSTAPAGADTRHLMQKEIAELFAVDRVTVKNWGDKHGCPRNANDSYNLADVITWWRDFESRKSGVHVEAKDRMRDAKAERLELQVARERGDLLDRVEAVNGYTARFQAVVDSFRYKARELAATAHGQTIDRIEQICQAFFEDIMNAWLAVPEFLALPPPLAERYGAILKELATACHGEESRSREDTEHTEK